jgi:hypothetical protein
MNINYQVKRKAVTDKEIFDFFSLIEDKFESNTGGLQNIMEIFNKYNNTK